MTKFYIVFSPEGMTAPVRTHSTHREAATAAWRMAKFHPGQSFFIMGKAGRPALVEATDAIPELLEQSRTHDERCLEAVESLPDIRAAFVEELK